jgi:hypothetical protein
MEREIDSRVKPGKRTPSEHWSSFMDVWYILWLSPLLRWLSGALSWVSRICNTSLVDLGQHYPAR